MEQACGVTLKVIAILANGTKVWPQVMAFTLKKMAVDMKDHLNISLKAVKGLRNS